MQTFGPYTPDRQAGNYFYVSGQVGVDPETKTASPNIQEQTSQVLSNMSAALHQHGLDMQDVVKTTIYVTTMDDFAKVNEVYEQFFAAPRPARATVGVTSLPNVANTPLMVEIEAVAYKEAA